MSDKINITVTTDGPIKFSNFEAIKFAGNTLETKEEAYICRCGESKNPPFCDGSHKEAGFSGKNEKENVLPLRMWKGTTISTEFDANLCMHVFTCKPLKEFRAREEAGADPEAAAEIIKYVRACPSGALRYTMNDQPERGPLPSDRTIEIIEGAEIRVQSQYEANGFEAIDGQPDNRLTLCRCGLSKNKPFCDGRHKSKQDFK